MLSMFDSLMMNLDTRKSSNVSWSRGGQVLQTLSDRKPEFWLHYLCYVRYTLKSSTTLPY